MFSSLDLMEDKLFRSAALNMAIDEALLEQCVRPTIRFYSWDHPALSFGYFGAFADVAHELPQRDAVRRWTGGGMVMHGEDLTYALVLPAAGARLASRDVYHAVHLALCDALHAAGQASELAKSAPARLSQSCFASPVLADVLVGEKKIAGAAHRRTRAGLLHQGSIQGISLPPDLACIFASKLAEQITERELPQATFERAEQIAQLRYSTENWLRAR